MRHLAEQALGGMLRALGVPVDNSLSARIPITAGGWSKLNRRITLTLTLFAQWKYCATT